MMKSLSMLRVSMFAVLALMGCNGVQTVDHGDKDVVAGTPSALMAESAFDVYDINWVHTDDGSQVVRTSRYIDASPEEVWDRVAHPNQYRTWSNAIHALLLGTPAAGKTIALSTELFPGKPRVLTFEKIGTFDNQRMAVSWYADFGSGGQVIRWQVVVPEGNGSRYYTAEKIPDTGLGFIIYLLTGEAIQGLFETIADELKIAVENMPD
jgi:hypothetical protein